MIAPDDILNARILIVDDSAVNVLLLERILQGAGYTSVTTTTDPQTVCDLYREHHYDLILLDIMMPGLDGFQVMQGLQEIETEGYLPVLVLTAQPSHKLRALQAGAKDFLSKPFDQVEVLARIHNMLEVRLLLRESREHGRLLERYDQLTGLPNRRLYRELLARALRRPDGHTEVVAALFIAVDRFKDLNDTLGRSFGGALLRALGDRLAGCVGPMDTTARLEGQEFGLVVTTPGNDLHGAEAVANAVRNALRVPLSWEGHEVVVTASIGIAVAPTDGTEADALLKHAGMALRDAKDGGGDAYRFYSAEMNARALENLTMETALRNALAREEFILHYQPKMRLSTGEWSGAEALLRWNRPGHGLVEPSHFISVLEDTGLIVPVGTWVIDAACRQIAEWADSGVEGIHVAVNVSGKQFLRAGFVADVARAIRENAIAPGSLDIEITERSLMSCSEEVNGILRELKALGVSIAIDDFGTGYSSLAYLKRFPIDTLKIDISFIRDVTTSADDAAITLAIINIARALKMTVVAEGVETELQLEFLRLHECDEIQGYYFSLPLPAAGLAALRVGNHAGTLSDALVEAS